MRVLFGWYIPAGNALLSLLNGDKRYPQKELNVSEDDLAWIFRNAKTAEDSARIDSMYDLSAFAPSNLVFLLDVSASMRKPLAPASLA